tara:strand:- start:140 stop:1030 length:891 start_codon:yes stop_codon:yes gene_type:complete
MKLLYSALATLILLLTGCYSQHNIRSGGLNVATTEIPDNHLMFSEISADEIEYNTVFGIRRGDKKHNPSQTTIINYNGSNTNSMSANLKPLQVVSFVLSSMSIFLPLTGLLSVSEEFIMAGIGSLLVGGVINENVWSNYHSKNSIGEVNDLLIKANSDIDYYINPTYNITTTLGPFNSTRSISGKAIGIEISDSLFAETKHISSNSLYEIERETKGATDYTSTSASEMQVSGLYFKNNSARGVAFNLLNIAMIEDEKKVLISFKEKPKEIIEIWIDPWSDRLIWLDEEARQEAIDY